MSLPQANYIFACLEKKELLTEDASIYQLQARLKAALQGKREHHYLHIGDSGVRNNLASIGG